MTCRHLDRSVEAYRVDALTGDQTPVTVYLCTWADANPDRLMDAPRWLQTWALSGGPNFNPERDCVGCPGFSRATGLPVGKDG